LLLDLYFSMERLRGQTLRERLRAAGRKRMPLAAVTAIARQMIEALQYAQRLIVHRDIKPENTWVCADGTASCSRRVLRGGSWNFGAGFQRSANRSGQRSEVTVNLLGFRLARTL
jgi:serine/threonine protein kinase